MDEQTVTEILDQLRDGELDSFHVSNEQFIAFRQVLVKREDFKHFRGIAEQGGSTVYQFMKEPRS
ncbi:hypothetical protein ACFFIX_03965 [Metabacillus herbersteinensis]|uniref:Abortive phage infection protein n=1 Tax=Metabacillus herbersteinensis TaxID=283816 RepID=A0ABV6GBL8_9BACI